MAPKSKKKDLFYVHNRYRDGLYIPHRKRTHLYWFKFLQEAERSPDYQVDWSKYRKWGGRKAVMNSKFDDWWEEYWKSLFGVKERNGTPKVELSTKSPKTETIRMTWLVWMYRDTPQTMCLEEVGMEGELSIRNEVPITSPLLVGSSQLRNAGDRMSHRPTLTTKQMRTVIRKSVSLFFVTNAVVG